MSNSSNAGTGGLIGGIIAAVISYALNGSFLWAVLAFFFNWFYILYAVIFRTKEIIPALKVMFGV